MELAAKKWLVLDTLHDKAAKQLPTGAVHHPLWSQRLPQHLLLQHRNSSTQIIHLLLQVHLLLCRHFQASYLLLQVRYPHLLLQTQLLKLLHLLLLLLLYACAYLQQHRQQFGVSGDVLNPSCELPLQCRTQACVDRCGAVGRCLQTRS